VETEVAYLKQKGVSSFDAIAQQITRVGRGQAPAMTPIPDGVSFPPDYSISRQACHKDFRKAIAREPSLAVEELRKIDHVRSEDMFLNLQPAISKGNVRAIETGIKLLDHSAKINGYAAPQKHEITGKDGLDHGGAISIEFARSMIADLERGRAAVRTAVPGPTVDDAVVADVGVLTIDEAHAAIAAFDADGDSKKKVTKRKVIKKKVTR